MSTEMAGAVAKRGPPPLTEPVEPLHPGQGFHSGKPAGRVTWMRATTAYGSAAHTKASAPLLSSI
jgi:hypothetical protein